MKDVTKFPHAQYTSTRDGDSSLPPMQTAWLGALATFLDKYGRMPDFDILYFRGASSTTDITVEVWEDDS